MTQSPSVSAPAMSQTDAVVQGIKSMIVTGELRAGDRLPVEPDLAARLKVSRGPLREGVRALSAMGVLTTRQGSGTYVTALDSEVLLAPLGFVIDLHSEPDSLSVLQIRRVLETEAAGRAADRITPSEIERAGAILSRIQLMLDSGDVDHQELLDIDVAFHQVIAKAAGNPVLSALIEALSGRTMRARLWRAVAQDSANMSSHREHLAILAALARHDSDRARVAMAGHLFAVEDFVRTSAPADTASGNADGR